MSDYIIPAVTIVIIPVLVWLFKFTKKKAKESLVKIIDDKITSPIQKVQNTIVLIDAKQEITIRYLITKVKDNGFKAFYDSELESLMKELKLEKLIEEKQNAR